MDAHSTVTAEEGDRYSLRPPSFVLKENIMEDRYIPKIARQDLIHGAYYRGRCRNATEARWNADEGQFYHWRYKFGWRVDCIKHPEDEKNFDVFVVEALIATPEKEIPFE
jgi:hypothetical protein